jgi:hypothetical protein
VLRCRSGAPPPLAFRPVPVILLWAGPRTLRRVCFENRGKRSVETVEPKFVSQVTLAPAPWDDCNDQSNDQRSPAAYLLWGVHRERHVCGEAEHRGLVATAPSTSGRRAGIPSAPALSLRGHYTPPPSGNPERAARALSLRGHYTPPRQSVDWRLERPAPCRQSDRIARKKALPNRG